MSSGNPSKIARVECVDAREAICLHGGDDLQIKYPSTGYWVALQQFHQSVDSLHAPERPEPGVQADQANPK